MTEFREQDLAGARFERVSLRGATFTQVVLNDARMHAVDFTGAQVRGASLDEVLAVRRDRQAMVRHVIESLTVEQLASEVTHAESGWPQVQNFPFKECLRIVLSEEWEHRLYAERDMTSLESEN